MSIKYVAKQDVFFHTSQSEMYRRHEAIRVMLRDNYVGAAVLISRNGAPRSYLRGGRFGGILSGGDGIYSGGDILLADGDMYITGDVDGFTQWAVGHRSPVTPSVEPGVWELAEFDAALILDGFQSAGNRRLGLIYPDMMDIALAEYLQAYVGDYEAVDLTAAFEQLWTKRSPEEIEMERRVVQMHEQVFRAIPAVLHSGMTEHECVSRIRDLFYRNGYGDLTRWIDCWMELRSGTDGMPEEPEQAFPGRVLKKGDRVDIAVHTIGENTLYAMCARSFVLADAPEPERHVRQGMELGINYFDHADIYGGGACERLFSTVISDQPALRQRMVIQSKCGIRDGYYDFSKAYILESVDGILSRLGTDYLDILLLHRPDVLMEPEEVAEAFDQLELLGQTVHQRLILNQLQLSAVHTPVVDSGIAANTLLPQGIDRTGSVLEYCRARNMMIQDWSPFQKGTFGGPFVGDRTHYPELCGMLDLLAERYGVTPTAIAVAWLLRIPGQTSVVLGTVHEDHLRESCAGAEIILTRKECDARVSERALREIYLWGFAYCVLHEKPMAVMTSYNPLNGHRTSENPQLLIGILREEWGYQGLVMTDWWNHAAHAKELGAGNDVRMPAGEPEQLMGAIRSGSLTEAEVRRSAKRVLELILRLGGTEA